MATVELQFHPPLSYKITSQKVGPYKVEIQFTEGDSLADLFDNLQNTNPEFWMHFYNHKLCQMRKPIRVVLNNNAISYRRFSNTKLHDKDLVKFIIIYGGG